MNIAIHFEIPVQDLERAIRFTKRSSTCSGVGRDRWQRDGALPLHEGQEGEFRRSGERGELCAEPEWHPDLQVPGHRARTLGRALQLGGECLYPRDPGERTDPGGGIQGLRGQPHRLAGDGANLTHQGMVP